MLSATGNASVSNDTLALTADGVINNNGLFFQGNNTISGGAGTAFGDGIRCCGGSVVRIQVVNPPGTTSPATAQMTETATTNGPNGTIVPGGKKASDLVTTFNSGAQFSISNIVETVHGKVIARYNPTVTSAKKKTKVKKLKVTKQTGATFINLHIRGLKPHAKLKLTLKALRLGISTDPANPAGAVTTQITPTTS